MGYGRAAAKQPARAARRALGTPEFCWRLLPAGIGVFLQDKEGVLWRRRSPNWSEAPKEF